MTTSLASSPLQADCPPRYATPRNYDRKTLGPAVAEVARRLGRPFMPWQRSVADVLCEIDPNTGRLAYTEWGLTVPRQSGKSTFVMAKAVHRASATEFFGRRQRVVYTAQTRQKAREKWEEDYLGDITNSPTFKGKVAPHLGNGNEHLRFPNGSRFGIEANTEKAGHGGTLDEAFMDEVFAHVDNRLEQAFRPAMITRKNKQLGWISTAGWLGGSPFLEAKVVLGREAVERNDGTGLAYFEWSADPDCDIEDPRVWRSCMPALGFTITEADIAIELEAMRKRPNDFRRAYLNLWVPKDAPDEQVIDPVLWAGLFDEQSKSKAVTAFGFDVQPGSVSASVGHAGPRADGLMDVEIVHAESGTDWCVPLLVTLWLKHRVPVVLDPTSPAGAFQAELERRGVKVITVDSRQYGHGCQTFVSEAEARRIRHRGWNTLDDALACAKTRNIGDGGFGWARKTVSADISPLVAVTLAMWAAMNAAKPRNFWGAIA